MNKKKTQSAGPSFFIVSSYLQLRKEYLLSHARQMAFRGLAGSRWVYRVSDG